MAGYYSDSDSDSYDSCEEYSNVEYGVHSLVSFGLPSFYQLGPVGRREEEEGIYEMVGDADDQYLHRFYGKVCCVLPLRRL